jgi:hypothetical protein
VEPSKPKAAIHTPNLTSEWVVLVNDEEVKMIQDVVDLSEAEKQLLSQVLKAVRSIRFGYVHIVVQDSKVVQIEKAEKTRFDRKTSR